MTLLLYFILHFDRLELLSDICEIILIPDQKQSSLSRALTPLITHRKGKHRECFFPINEGLPFYSYNVIPHVQKQVHNQRLGLYPNHSR